MTSLLFVTISYPVILGLLRDQEEESKHKAEMTMDLKEVFSCDDKMIQKQQEWKEFCKKWKEYYPVFGNKMNNERNVYYFTYLEYNYKIRSMIYTTKWIERLNRDYKRTTKMRGALPDPESTILLLRHVAMRRKSYEYKIPLFKMEDKKFRWEE